MEDKSITGPQEIRTFNTTKGPKAIGPYSTAKIFHNIMYLSGQIGLDPKTGQLVPGGVEKQTRQAMQNLKTIFGQVGTTFDNVLKCTLYLRTMDDFTTVNAIYGQYFGKQPPSRVAIAVAQLPKNAKFQIDTTVALFN